MKCHMSASPAESPNGAGRSDTPKLPPRQTANQSNLFHNYGRVGTGFLTADTCLASKAPAIYAVVMTRIMMDPVGRRFASEIVSSSHWKA